MNQLYQDDRPHESLDRWQNCSKNLLQYTQFEFMIHMLLCSEKTKGVFPSGEISRCESGP